MLPRAAFWARLLLVCNGEIKLTISAGHHIICGHAVIPIPQYPFYMGYKEVLRSGEPSEVISAVATFLFMHLGFAGVFISGGFKFS